MNGMLWQNEKNDGEVEGKHATQSQSARLKKSADAASFQNFKTVQVTEDESKFTVCILPSVHHNGLLQCTPVYQKVLLPSLSSSCPYVLNQNNYKYYNLTRKRLTSGNVVASGRAETNNYFCC